jgi:hypothetical protein
MREVYECTGCHDVLDITVLESEALAKVDRWMTEHEGCEGMGEGLTDEERERGEVVRAKMQEES